MTSPDANTWLILLFNCIAYVIMWFRKTRADGIADYQHNKMWRDYEKRHGINGTAQSKMEDIL